MRLPSFIRYFVPVPRHEPMRRPQFEADYVLRLRQEAAAKALPVNSIRAVLYARETRRMAR